MNRKSKFMRIPSTRPVDVGEDSGSMKRLVVGLATTALLSGFLGLIGVGSAAGRAHADDGPIGPKQWCPGDSLWITGNHVTNPVIWDNNVCHSYYIVDFGQGNVAQNIWDGADPPAPPPPPPPPLIGDYQDCLQKLGPLSMFCPKG
jgi:hypothetical protein